LRAARFGIIAAMSTVAAPDIPVVERLRLLEDFFLEHPRAAVLEDGRVLFDMELARYSLTAEHGRCLLHLWSEERNIVRTVVGLRPRKDSLRIETQRFGQTRTQALEIVPDRDRRSPSTRDASRSKYQRLLERVLAREFSDWTVEGMRTAADLEHSFGPAYTRGILRQGMNRYAVIAVNSAESQTAIDGALTAGILWLAYCREHADGKELFQGLKIFLPKSTCRTVRTRMAWLNTVSCKWELYEFDEREERFDPLDCTGDGNLALKLVYAFDPVNATERCRKALDHVLAIIPPELSNRAEIRANGPSEISLALHGLEFARIRQGFSPNSFTTRQEIVFGAGANETKLTPDTEALFLHLAGKLCENRDSAADARNPLYRLQPERWLESLLRKDIAEIEPSIRGDIVYTQVPAFSAGDRGMLDLLTVTHSGRLGVIEIKADDDFHLPLQALDYWSRVRQLHHEQAFQKHGYFRGIELSDQAPLLYLIAPVLRIHPATDVILRHLSAGIPWQVIGLNEDWRKRRRVILRKRSESWT
jgi:hypothetical protein